eukprot:700531-Pyramimonas_sp.AAC.1
MRDRGARVHKVRTVLAPRPRRISLATRMRHSRGREVNRIPSENISARWCAAHARVIPAIARVLRADVTSAIEA